MSTAGNSASAYGQRARAYARRGWWRPVLSAAGVTVHTRAADARAARWELGGEWERVTARILAPLEAEGWHVLHDRRLPRSRANLDHVLVMPCGSGIVMLDTKRWDVSRETAAPGGRLHCGWEDRHDEAVKVSDYAHRVAKEVRVPDGMVAPLLVVHGSKIPGGAVGARVEGRREPVYVLDPDWLLSTLRGPVGPRNARAAQTLAERVKAALPVHEGG